MLVKRLGIFNNKTYTNPVKFLLSSPCQLGIWYFKGFSRPVPVMGHWLSLSTQSTKPNILYQDMKHFGVFLYITFTSFQQYAGSSLNDHNFVTSLDEYLPCSLKLSTLLCFFCGVGVSDPPTLDEDFSTEGGLSSIMSADANGGLLGLLNLQRCI